MAFDLTQLNYTFSNCDSFDWDFGDGSPHASTRSPAHAFSVGSGTQSFTVTATISNPKGSLPLQQTVAVQAIGGLCNEAPTKIKLIPKFSGTTSGCTNKNSTPCLRNEPVAFSIDAILYNFQSCDSVLWDFGDGTAAPGRSVTHAYAGSASSFQASATVTNESGTVKLDPLTVPMPPSAIAFVVSPAAPMAGKPVKFTIVAPPAGVAKWEWSFGDGNGSMRVQSDATYTEGYAAAGTYAVQVVARNAEGEMIGTATQQLAVTPRAKPHVTPH